MNVGGTQLTALVRALYSAIIAGLVAGLTAYQTGSATNDAIITGLLAGLAILGTRGLFEGQYDESRDKAGNVKPSDVTPNP